MISSLTVVTTVAAIQRHLLGIDLDTIKTFERVTGIKKTRQTHLTATRLAVEAVETHQDFNKTALAAGAIIVVTQSPDRSSPCMAMDIHKALGYGPHVAAFDVNQSCDGFIYGLWLAEQLKVPTLLVCVDKLRAPEGGVDSLIFSDAASVAMVNPTLGQGSFNDPWFLTDSSGIEKLRSDEKGLLRMDGGAVFDFVTTRIPKLMRDYNTSYGERFEFLAQHQPNLSMMKIVERRSGFEGRSLHSIEEFGNMSMVSIPCALAMHEQKILGKKVLLCGYGAGWSAAVMGVTWSDTACARVVLL